MTGYRIVPGDMRRFRAAFRDSQCALCEQPIYAGEPIGYLDYYDKVKRFGPLCMSCISHQGVRFRVEELNGPPRQPIRKGRC